MAQFRKRPVVIDAVQWTGMNVDEVFDFARETDRAFGINHGTDQVEIGTLEGTMCANVGDWIIRGVKGELYPCKPDIFAATYEPLTTPAAEESENARPSS